MENFELKIFREKIKEIEDLEKNLNKYFETIKEICKKYNAKVFLSGSFGTERWTKASDIDIVVIVKDKKDIEKILFELREKIKNKRLNFHIITEEYKDLYHLKPL